MITDVAVWLTLQAAPEEPSSGALRFPPRCIFLSALASGLLEGGATGEEVELVIPVPLSPSYGKDVLRNVVGALEIIADAHDCDDVNVALASTEGLVSLRDCTVCPDGDDDGDSGEGHPGNAAESPLSEFLLLSGGRPPMNAALRHYFLEVVLSHRGLECDHMLVELIHACSFLGCRELLEAASRVLTELIVSCNESDLLHLNRYGTFAGGAISEPLSLSPEEKAAVLQDVLLMLRMTSA